MDFVHAIKRLEKSLGMPVWLLVQNGNHEFAHMNEHVKEAFFSARSSLPLTPIALLIESPGGQADCAYHIARMLRRHCGSFTAVVGSYAKSAATLLCLGADQIMLGAHAELGPLDAQFVDQDREVMGSALDEAQALERLHAAALDMIDETVMLLATRTGKRTDIVIPHALKFVADMMRPLLEKIDAVQYSQRSRMLKVAEEYAARLLAPNYPPDVAEDIASRLVEDYPQHGFVIDSEEAKDIGLLVQDLNDEQQQLLDDIREHLQTITVIGRIEP